MKVSYKNPFYNKHYQGSERIINPRYEDSTKYRGFLIYQRNSFVFDIVKNGICIGMYAGLNGAKRRIDELIQQQGGKP